MVKIGEGCVLFCFLFGVVLERWVVFCSVVYDIIIKYVFELVGIWSYYIRRDFIYMCRYFMNLVYLCLNVYSEIFNI